MYAYEVDGLGNHLTDFDDPNLPSLLALPLLGYGLYDRQVWNILVWNGVLIWAMDRQGCGSAWSGGLRENRVPNPVLHLPDSFPIKRDPSLRSSLASS